MRSRIARYLSNPRALTLTSVGIIAVLAVLDIALKPSELLEIGGLAIAEVGTALLMLAGVVYQLCTRQWLRSVGTFVLGNVVVFVLFMAGFVCFAYHRQHQPWVWTNCVVRLPENLGKITMYSRPPSPPSWFPSQDNSPQWVMVVTRPDGQYSRIDLGQRSETTTKDLEIGIVRRGAKRYVRLADDQVKDYVDLRTGQESDQQAGTVERLGSFDGPTTFLPWHDKPAASGGLYWPSGIAVDRAGNVYVVDAASDRLIKYSSQGRYLAQWPVGEDHAIYDVATDDRGHVWVTSWSAALHKYGTDGQSLGAFGTFPDATGVGCGTGGSVYVTERTGTIEVVSQDGRVLATWGQRRDGDIGFCGAAGASDGSVVAAHWGSNQIRRFSAQGQMLKKWRAGGGPVDVAVDEEDNLYVALDGGQTLKVAKFNLAGRRLARWDTLAVGDDSARRLAVRQGVVYLADRKGHRVLRYTTNGQPLPDFGIEAK